jgi:hypothetical protein
VQIINTVVLLSRHTPSESPSRTGSSSPPSPPSPLFLLSSPLPLSNSLPLPLQQPSPPRSLYHGLPAGWAGVSVSLHGPPAEDPRPHFVERWTFIHDSKYYGSRGHEIQKTGFPWATNLVSWPSNPFHAPTLQSQYQPPAPGAPGLSPVPCIDLADDSTFDIRAIMSSSTNPSTAEAIVSWI